MSNRSKINIYAPILIVIGAIFGAVGGYYGSQKSMRANMMRYFNTLSMPDNKLSYTLSLIENKYVDSISTDTLVEHVMPTLVKELDPHSVYIPAQEVQQVNEPLEGEFDGIGVVFNMATDTVIVINVIPSGPSAKAGILAGDRIVKVDADTIAGVKMPQDKVMKLLRGPRESTVKLSVERNGIDDLLEFDVVRDVIPMHSIEAALILEDSVGYIKLSQFARTSHTELLEAFAKLRAEGMTKLIFDLRDNSGGYLDQAINIANEFMADGELIVYTEDRHKQRIEEFSNGKGSAQDLEVAVLINEGSASSSEILAGALQDNDKGTIIGRRSFGKGLVQQQIPFGDGSALRLTVARYFTPTGRSIQKPYTSGDADGYELDLYNRYKNNELFSVDSVHFADSLKFTTPKGKIVYGGGGIMPDIFVPADTTDVTPYFVEVTGRSILYRYTIEYSDKHRDKLSAVKTKEDLQRMLDGDKRLVEDFIAYASSKGVKPKWGDIKRSRHLIEAQLRAYIGRNTVLDENGFYMNIYPIDVTILRAIEELKKH